VVHFFLNLLQVRPGLTSPRQGKLSGITFTHWMPFLPPNHHHRSRFC